MTPITPSSWVMTRAAEAMPVMQGLMQLPRKYRKQLLKDVMLPELEFTCKYNACSDAVVCMAADLFGEVNEASVHMIMRTLDLLRLREYQPHCSVLLDMINKSTVLACCEIFTGEHLFLPLQINCMFTNHVLHIQKIHNECSFDGKSCDGIIVNVYILQSIQPIYSVIIMDSNPNWFFVHEQCIPPIDDEEPVGFGYLGSIPLKAYRFIMLPEDDILTLYLKAVVRAIHDYNMTGGFNFGSN